MPLRWGLVGAGLISHDFVVALSTLPSSKHAVVSICDTFSKTDAQEFAQRHNIPKICTSLDEFLSDETIDVVYIGTIHITHHEIALRVLHAKKPALCEKPMSINVQNTSDMISKAREVGVFFMEATWMRFFPAVVELQKMIANNDIGEVRFVRANFSFRRPPVRAKGRLTDPKLGGGSVLDVGVYTISFATMIFRGERPEKIYAQGTLLPTGVDDLAVITLTYSNNRIAQLSCSISYDIMCEAVVCGTKNELVLPHPFWCSTKLETTKGVYEKPMISKKYPLPESSMPGNYPNHTGLSYEAEEVYDCIKQGRVESNIMPLDQTLVVAEITQEVLKQIGVVHYSTDQGN